MDTNVQHQPRVAFDAATILVDVSGADEDLCARYGDQLAVVLGPSYLREFLATRDQLLRSQHDNVRSIEAGKWRARLEDVLRKRADVAESLHQLTLSTCARLAHTN